MLILNVFSTAKNPKFVPQFKGPGEIIDSDSEEEIDSLCNGQCASCDSEGDYF